MQTLFKDLSPGRYDLTLGLAFGSLILLLMLIVAGAASSYYEEASTRDEGKMASMLSVILRDSIERIGFSGKHHTRLLVKEVSEKLPGLNVIEVSDLKGELIAHTDTTLVGSTIPVYEWRNFAPLLAGEVPHLIEVQQTEQGGVISVSLPYFSGFDQKLAGIVTLEVSTADYEHDLRAGRQNLLVLILFLLLLSTTIVVWLSNLFGQALRQADMQKQEAEREARTASEESRAKSDFLAVMSHEIRTPMNGVLGMAQLLAHTPLNEQQRNHLRIINDCGESLLEVINDILDYSKISSGKLEIESVDVEFRATVHDCIETFSAQAEETGIPLLSEISSNIPVCIKTDPLRLRQVLVNLISNAYKFADSGQVHLKAEQLDSQLRIEVIDSGIGISAKQQEHLFSPFTQADSSTSRQYGGTGLGLAICKQLVEGMGGTIGVNSSPGNGSCFWLVLPLEPGNSTDFNPTTRSPGVPAAAAETALPDFSHLHVLVAEDNTTNQMVIEGMLARYSISPVFVFDGLAAIEAVEESEEVFNLILMDCEMPRMDGYTATRELKKTWSVGANTEAPAPIIIGISAHASTGHRDQALAAGMDDYLSKPLAPTELENTLKKYFKGQHSRQGIG